MEAIRSSRGPACAIQASGLEDSHVADPLRNAKPGRLPNGTRPAYNNPESAINLGGSLYNEMGDDINPNASQPSLTHSLSTNAESTPSSVCRPDFNDFAHERYSNDVGQGLDSGMHTPFDDDSDVDDVLTSVPVPRVSFVTPVVHRDASNSRVLGMKKRIQRTNLSTAPEHPSADLQRLRSPTDDSSYAFPDVLARSAAMNSSGSIRGGRRAQSSARANDIELESLSFKDRSLPPLPTPNFALSSTPFGADPESTNRNISTPAGRQVRPPLSVLDEFEWHGRGAQPQQRGESAAATARLAQLHKPSTTAIRKVSSKATLVPNKEVGQEPNPFAFSPPSFSSHGDAEDVDRQSVSSQPRGSHSFSNLGSPSLLSLHSNGSAGLEPREILRRAKTTRFTCGLDEELDYTGSVAEEDETEVLAEDLPPLLSTYYLKSGDFAHLPKHELDRLERKAEKMMAAHTAKLAADRSKFKFKKGAPPSRTYEFEPVSILVAEAKFLAEDDSMSKGKSVLKKKSMSNAKISGRTRLNTASSTESRKQLNYLPVYIDGNSGHYSSGSSTHESSSLSSFVHTDSRSRFSMVSSSNTSQSSHAMERSRHKVELDSAASSRSSLGRLFGKKTPKAYRN